MMWLRTGLAGIALLAGAGVALGQDARVAVAPVTRSAAPASPDADAAPKQSGQTVLMMRGLDKITGRPTDITAPIGKPVEFATLTITARYCYSTPPSETPETAAFVQIDDHRPDQPARRIFSGWMYASSPGLNALQHPLYDVWVITCRGSSAPQAVVSSAAPAEVASPDAADKDDKVEELPPDAGR
jgi:hypothetical protein